MAITARSQAPTGVSDAERAQRWRPYQIVFWLVCLAAVIAFPLIISDPAITTVAFFTLVFAAAGSAWNIFCGYTGYIALGHAVFFGTGCYALTIICAHWHIAGGWAPFEFVPETSDFLYVRLMGDLRSKYAGDGSPIYQYDSLLWPRTEALENWAVKVSRHLQGDLSAFIYVNNHFEGNAPLTCRRLARQFGLNLALPQPADLRAKLENEAQLSLL